MQVRLGRSEDNVNAIVRFRSEALVRCGEPNDIYPLPYAFYLFAFDHGAAEPLGMAEFFFYDQAFDRYDDCPYRQACDLARIACLEQAVHVRSLVVQPNSKQDALRQLLCESIVSIASELGGRCLTADAGIDLAQLQLATRSLRGLEPAPTSYLVLDREASSASEAAATRIDMLLAQTIRRRGRCALDAVKARPRLDRLLPAHWVGVWQRQLRVYAW
jgi:hypothetical protein